MSCDLNAFLLSSLEKVMRNETPVNKEYSKFSMLNNEKKSFQLFIDAKQEKNAEIEIISDINCIHTYTIEYVPSNFSINKKTADDYVIESKDGYYPDLLLPCNNSIVLENGKKTVWFEIYPDEPLKAGEHIIEIKVKSEKGFITCKITVEVIGCALKKQSLIFTNWFHTDCLMNEYGVEAFSDEYWRITENYLKTAAAYGMNCVLTPLFTPPLDTSVGGERPTVQLVDVKIKDGKYEFGFDKLSKWIELAQKCNIEYFEMSHFFTQWGAKRAPKIIAYENDTAKKIFGWHTCAASREYKKFLSDFSAELKKFLESRKLKEKVILHVSDEPDIRQYFHYLSAAKLIGRLFDGYKIIDALSDYIFYLSGAVKLPVPSNNHIEPFINKVPELWTYYCCVQDNKYVSNRFFSIPAQRNRVLGYQMYKYNVKGFLHWGFNFWYTRYSKRKINPYEITDAGGEFQSGDSFVVYPNKDGTPYCSTRLKVFYDGLQDMAALQTLEQLIGRGKTLLLLEHNLKNEITFSEYPHSAEWQLETRERINAEIKNNI